MKSDTEHNHSPLERRSSHISLAINVQTQKNSTFIFQLFDF